MQRRAPAATWRRAPRSRDASTAAPSAAAARASVETRSGRPFDRSRSRIVSILCVAEHDCEVDDRLRKPPRQRSRTSDAARPGRGSCRSVPPHGRRVVPGWRGVSRVPECSSRASSSRCVAVAALVVRLVRGRLAPHARARGRCRRPAGRARRAADRTPLRLPSRSSALAREPSERARGRLGGRAAAGPRVRDGGPRLASPR